MSIVDALLPRFIPTPVAETIHKLQDDEDMSPKIIAITSALAAAGRPLTITELSQATGYEGKDMSNALYTSKKAGAIEKNGKLYSLLDGFKLPAGFSDHAATSKKPTPAAIKSTPRTEKNKMNGAPPPAVAYDDEPRALQLRSGDVIVFSGNRIIAELNRAEYQAVLALDYQ